MILKFIYTLFLALLVALFVGLGIDDFYPGPKTPEVPIVLQTEKPGCEDTKFRFLIVTIGLVIALVLGYVKFIQPKEELKK